MKASIFSALIAMIVVSAPAFAASAAPAYRFDMGTAASELADAVAGNLTARGAIELIQNQR